MRQYWRKFAGRIDNMSLRERVLVFAALAFLLVALVQVLYIDPLLAEQKKLSAKVTQQQEKMKEIRAQIEASLHARKSDADSPLRKRLSQIRQQLADGDAYLQSRRDRLVAPEKMADLLGQVLSKNGKLQLVNLQTIAATPLIEKTTSKPEGAGIAAANAAAELNKQVFKHGVQITVRGSYLDLMQYLSSLEQLPTKMFWGAARMNVVQYPAVELTLTLYTLSLDKSWLQI